MKKVATLLFVIGLSNCWGTAGYPFGRPKDIEVARYNMMTSRVEGEATHLIEPGRSINDDPVEALPRAKPPISRWIYCTAGCLAFSAVAVVGFAFYGAVEQQREGNSNFTQG